ncbi:ras-domain-containing protein [Histomonas meleagridis]|uniref:ras-domain-containing protein n=1 Tax=Histomonas meleagridis TaxID=135588 RepID=UPI003559E49B|nr:ras-domain-containing protein [Histomonas meleagridis]KAH0798656.1 ras-domain-containing protein [Histomonas meleagridis]
MDDSTLCKVIVVGSSKAKKTVFILRATDPINSESPSYITTIGADFKIYKATIRGKQIKMQIWDTAGNERFGSILRSYYRGCRAIIYLYKTTSRETYEAMIGFMSSSQQYITDPNVFQYVVAFTKNQNKTPQVIPDEGRQIATRFNATFLEATFFDQRSCQGVLDKVGLDVLQQIFGPLKDENEKEKELKMKFKSNQKQEKQKQKPMPPPKQNKTDGTNNNEGNNDGRTEVCFIQ